MRLVLVAVIAFDSLLCILGVIGLCAVMYCAYLELTRTPEEREYYEHE